MLERVHFLDIPPLRQIQVLCNADQLLLIRYASSVLCAFRRRVRASVSPFPANTMEEEEYYKIRGCMDMERLGYQAYRLETASPLSSSAQRILKEWLENIIIECVDECPWTPALQRELDLLILPYSMRVDYK